MRVSLSSCVWLVSLPLGLLLGCDEVASSEDAAIPATDGAPSIDGGGPAPDGGTPGEPDGGGLADGGEPALDGGADGGAPPVLGEIAGGPIGAAPIVGCEEAERPARRLATVTEVCDASGAGRCWYVDADAAEGGDGSFASPFAVPQEAVRGAGPGDVIYLRGGVYDDDNAHDGAAVRWDDEAAGVQRRLISVTRVALPSWAGGTVYTVASGTAADPITVRSYPGERACAQEAGSISIGSLAQETAHWVFRELTIQGDGVFIGGGTRGDDGEPAHQTHHITLNQMEIFDFSGNERDNVGLVRINRGDWGGPSEITVSSNILHDLSVVEDGVLLDWSETTDAQHFGSVTTLSCESYVMPYGECVGTGRIVIRNNHVYRVPSAFFLKNPSLGPVEITGNVVHDVRYLGQWSPSNITFEDNLVYRGSAAQVGGFGGDTGDLVYARAGRDLVMQRNTFIGMNTVAVFRVYASGHTIRDNVVQGLTYGEDDASWDHMGYVVQDANSNRPDDAVDIADAQIAIDNDFDDNCFVTDEADFLAYGRRRGTGSGTELTHLVLSEARATLAHEVSSVVTADRAAVFEAFDAEDYRIASDGPCAGDGATVPSWHTP